jgi:hypothetical protein
MAASWAAAVALAVALSAGLSACDKDEDNGSDTELYKPAEDMTHEQILALFKEVNANMAKVRQMSVEETKKDAGKDKTTTHTSSITAQVNLDAKKEIEMRYEDEVLDRFTYTENDIAYEYDDDDYNTPQQRYKVSDVYWNHCETFDEFGDLGDFLESISEWKVEGDAFVGTVTENYATRKYTVSLTSSKKISSVKDEYSNNEYKYTYSANPTFPSNYKKLDFLPARQYSVKVVWGERLGESTFYAERYKETYNETVADFDPDEIVDYAPKVAGKKPRLYDDSKFTEELEGYDYDYDGDIEYSSIYLSNNNKVIYVKWVDDSGSTGKSKSKPVTKSRLFR